MVDFNSIKKNTNIPSKEEEQWKIRIKLHQNDSSNISLINNTIEWLKFGSSKFYLKTSLKNNLQFKLRTN